MLTNYCGIQLVAEHEEERNAAFFACHPAD